MEFHLLTSASADFPSSWPGNHVMSLTNLELLLQYLTTTI
jgi:hypothetical protein